MLHFRYSHRTIPESKCQDVSLLGWAGARYISPIYQSGERPQFLPQEIMVCIERVKEVSTWLEHAWSTAIPNPIGLLLALAAPDPN